MIYTDTIHLISDSSVEELHRFAVSIGLLHGWFQDHPLRPHYDLTTVRKRKKALDGGAKKVSPREIVEILRSTPYINERAKNVRGFNYVSGKRFIHMKHPDSLEKTLCMQDIGIMSHVQNPNIMEYHLCKTCLGKSK